MVKKKEKSEEELKEKPMKKARKKTNKEKKMLTQERKWKTPAFLHHKPSQINEEAKG